ncbi:probable WRKY transcription factor protein 1 [Anastrepha obliqua]|uniref:probable WRKY transcription factor protein 1 n=1 Tax=Anastrepha obliqua TaxID=95512 RepID=UPI00240A381B|nr:probable WRKY transcription factor protein 1 [Anastrepha obliqua]
MHKVSLDLSLGQHSNNNNYNNNNSNLSNSSSYSNDNECIFNCSNTKDLLIPNNNNNNTKMGRQMMAAQEKKTADEMVEDVRSANITNSGVKMGPVKPHNRDDIMYNAEEELRQTAGGLRATGGILVDESASYETDEYSTEETERMQLNPSGNDDDWDDEYDDGDEDEDEEDEDEEMDDADAAYGDEDDEDFVEEAHSVSAPAQAQDTGYEALPEAKGLIQSLVGDENESVKNMPDVLKAKSLSHTVGHTAMVDEEEEDMGFDEDDERIAIIVEKQRGNVNDNDKGFMNEEGSGAGSAKRRTDANRYKNNRFRLDYLEKYRRKQQKLQFEHTNRGVADSREGSGNFANDDDDDDDDDSDDDDGEDDDVDDDEAINVGAADDANDDADRQEGDGYFNSKHTKSSNRYFRKNTNDAIKIISTPLGKVGIVYQQTPTNEDGNNNANNKKQDSLGDKKTSSFTDFDALSPDPESSHRLASSHPKITPVLTPDGKVALLYRGDSENSKYEPIRNLTHKFNNKNDFTDNKATASGTISKETPDFPNNDGSEDESADESEDDYDLDNESNNDRLSTNSRKNNATPTDETQKAAIQNPDTDPDDPTAGGGSFIIRPTDSVLPMINRPLSEVLGIKKNQFKQFRIKDNPTTPPNGESAGDPRSLAGTSIDRTIDTTTLHFLTKVNLAEYPTSMKTRNFDFDFSRDNTMLDERSRHKEHQYHQQQQASAGSGSSNQLNGGEAGNNNNKLNTIANEEVLAKTEVVNLAIIPHFDEELERLQRLHENEGRRHYRQRYRQKPSEEELSGIHCIMQAMMGIAAISTVFGMLGTFFKQRILDQIRLMHW